MIIVRIITVAVIAFGVWLVYKMDRHIDKVVSEMRKDTKRWIPVPEILPEDELERNMPGDGEHVLLSFSNSDYLDIGRYEEDEEGGAFYPRGEDMSKVGHGMFVNAWMPLPEAYREKYK